MKAKNLCVYAGLCAGVASVATGQATKTVKDVTYELQQATAGQQIDPVRIAKAGMKDGKIVFQSDWMDYNGGASRATGVQIFDCYGDGSDGPADGVPDGGTLCGLGGETSRWYFGSGYCNLFTTNDMTLVDGAELANRFDYAWFWTVSGSFTSEYCIVAVFTQDSAPCDPDSFDYSGWLLDYGTLASGVGGGYYYSNVTLSTGTWPLPTGGSGSYFIFYLTAITTSGAWVLATCAQSMLWGSADIHGQYAGAGTQGPLQFDDDVFLDGSHTSSECYSYSYSSICPSILGAMAQFWGNTGGDACDYADCNGDGSVNTQDFLCYLGLWSAGNSAADCNGDGSINTQDFLCFLGIWSSCR